MKTGFRLLQTLPLNKNIDLEPFNKVLPPLYKVFIQSFYLGDNAIDQEFYLNDKNTLAFCSSFRYKNHLIPSDWLSFEGFTDIRIAIELYLEKEKYGYDDEREKGKFTIGYGASGSGIFVGLLEENIDQVFYLGETYSYKLADDIFEFVRGLESVSNSEDPEIMQNVPYDRLYKNWGEDFWRVRKDS
jgi:hypothetical protein